MKNAGFGIGALKAPCMDDLYALLFQSQWEIVGESVYNLIRYIFINPDKVERINEKLIVLIPKVDNPKLLKDF